MFKKIKNRLKAFLMNFYSKEKQARLSGVEIGSKSFINSKFWSNEAYLIKIGNNCAITNGVKIFTHGGSRVARLKYPKFDCFGKVVLGDNVYVGTNALIMPGVTIGSNVLIAAGSVVTNSVPSNVVIGGNPARIVCTLDQYIEKNMPFNLNSKGISSKKMKELLLSLPPHKFVSKKQMSVYNDKRFG